MAENRHDFIYPALNLVASDFDPKNRVETRLGVLDLEVRHKRGSTVLDQSIWAIAIINHYAGRTPLDVVLPIEGLKSVISGEPAVLFRSNECTGGLEIALTPSELVRYIGLDLFPHEYEMLVRLYGDHYRIHDDFYDPATGAALEGLYKRVTGHVLYIEHLDEQVVMPDRERPSEPGV